jgi:hypothetical protein
VSILSDRLHRAVAVLGLRRLAVMSLAMILVAGVMVVRMEVFLCERKRRLLKKMMDTMGRGKREKKNEKGDNP